MLQKNHKAILTAVQSIVSVLFSLSTLVQHIKRLFISAYYFWQSFVTIASICN